MTELAATRFRSLSVRQTFARFSPRLACIPLEHGYPPMPATHLNLWRFAPLVGYYGGKVWGKLAPRLGIKPALVVDHEQARQFDTEAKQFMQDSGITTWLESPRLLDTGLFEPAALTNFLTIDTPRKFRAEQWRRLVTLEALISRIQG